MTKAVIYFFILALLFSCQTSKKDEIDDSLGKKIESNGINVTTIIIKENTFQKQIISNGKIEVFQKSEVHFKIHTLLFIKKGRVLKTRIYT